MSIPLEELASLPSFYLPTISPDRQLHGTNDPRCPISQAHRFRDRLLDVGKVEGQDFEYVKLTEEGHGSTHISPKIRAFNTLADFMERQL